MDMVLWILAGGVLGWLGFSQFGFNEERGLSVSIAIGAAGGLFGGKIIAPMFAAANAVPGAFSPAALFFAAALAAAFLAAGNLVYNRWGV